MFSLIGGSMKTNNGTNGRTRYIDLHMHTDYSDGIGVDPMSNVVGCSLRGIDVMAISDHDHTAGYDAVKKKGVSYGVSILPASEITTPDYHLLALNFNPDDKELLTFLEDSRELQRDKVKIRIDRLKDQGVPINMGMVETMFPSSRLGKWNVFATMQRYCLDYMEGDTPELGAYQRFKYYNDRDTIGELPDVGVSDEKAIDVVHEAGGLIGLAHPPRDVQRVSEIERLIELGIDFLEIQPNEVSKYGNTSLINYELVAEIASKHDLPLSYGSDYHGATTGKLLLESGGINVLSDHLRDVLNRGHVKI